MASRACDAGKGREFAALPARPDAAFKRTTSSRLAVTSALHGEGVTFMTRSLASVLAYDTTESVVIVDLNWKNPVHHGRAGAVRPSRSIRLTVGPH